MLARSIELEASYKELEAERDRADAALTAIHRKKMGINTEKKQLETLTNEAKQFAALQAEKVRGPRWTVGGAQGAGPPAMRRLRPFAPHVCVEAASATAAGALARLGVPRIQADLERDLIVGRLYQVDAEIKERQSALDALRKEFQRDEAAQARRHLPRPGAWRLQCAHGGGGP